MGVLACNRSNLKSLSVFEDQSNSPVCASTPKTKRVESVTKTFRAGSVINSGEQKAAVSPSAFDAQIVFPVNLFKATILFSAPPAMK